MDSKTRVKNTFHHIKSDRVPIDFSINPTILGKVMQALNVTTYDQVLESFGVDFRGIGVPFIGENKYPNKPGLFVNPLYGYYTRWVKNEYGGYDDFCAFPLQNATSDEIDNFYVPSADDFDYTHVPEYIRACAPYALYVGNAGMSDVINATGRVMGMEDTLVNLMTEDEATLRYIQRRADMELGMLQRTIEAAKGGIDFLWMGEDLGTQDKPMISLELYRKVLRPFHQQFIDLAKSYDLPVMVHTCGSSSWVYPDFIEMGVDAVDTLQPEAKNMDPQYLVDHFGGKLSFHGCISTAGALANGSKAEVRAHIADTLDIMKPTYSYMFAPTHMIQDNTPVENILEMYRLAQELGKY